MNPDLFTATNLIVAITCVVSYLAFNSAVLRGQLIFHPLTINRHKQWYRFITSGFIHGNGMHLAINMFVLWSFGNAVEKAYYPDALGENSLIMYLTLYLGGIAVSSIPSYLKHKSNGYYSALGASGGVSAVVFAVIVFAPWQNLYLYGVIAIPQILAGGAYLYYSWHMDKKGGDNIGHMAHLSGAIWGFVFTCCMNFNLLPNFIQKTLAGPSWL
ncbi:MAG: membrane associated rhomboid family serine protease [Oceanicoccus sp.]|jgi:membrane associated rhomboid family serine protease